MKIVILPMLVAVLVASAFLKHPKAQPSLDKAISLLRAEGFSVALVVEKSNRVFVATITGESNVTLHYLGKQVR